MTIFNLPDKYNVGRIRKQVLQQSILETTGETVDKDDSRLSHGDVKVD